MTTEQKERERMVRAATRNLVEPEYPELRFHSESERSHSTIRFMVTIWVLLAIAGTAAAYKSHLIPFSATYTLATLLFIAIAVLWRR